MRKSLSICGLTRLEMEREEDSWLRYLLVHDFPRDFLQEESDQYSDSKDFLAFLKKPKIELLDRYEVDWDRKTDQLDRHEVDWNRNTDRSDRHEVPWDRETDQSVMKRNLGTWAVPNLDNLDHFPNPYANTEVKVKVHFLGLKKEYEKVQSRVNRQSRQRLTDGKVRIMVKAEAQITHIEVYVERAPMAAALSGDVTGRVPLRVKMGAQVINKHFLSVDLDSVYMSSQGTPVYKLSTVDADRRNRFRLVVTVFFIDGKGSRSFASPAFLLRSRRPERKKSF